TMIDAEHAPAMAPPVRTDEQIVPHNRWVPIGKSNCYLNEEKSQPSPIFKIVVDILKQTNFFRAFTASLTIPAIYIQQFWDTICFDSKAGSFKCQLDEQWFNLTQDTLRDALQITPVDNNRSFSSPPTPDTLVEFVNKLGFNKSLEIIFHLQRIATTSTQDPTTPTLLYLLRPVLGHSKFMLRKIQREVFGMTIPNELINDVIRGADYYDAYLEKVAKHQRSNCDSPAPKPAKSTKPKVTKQAKPVAPKAATKKPQPAPTKPKVTKQAKPIAPKAVTKEPQPAPTKPKEKKRKHAKETTETTPPAKRAKVGKVVDTQRAIKESMKDAHGAPRGPLPPVMFRETNTGKFQPLPKIEGKGKDKRRTSAPTKPSGPDGPSSLYIELGLTESDTESDEEMPPVVKSGDQDEGQAGPGPSIQDKGQAKPNPDDVAESQPLSTPGVHAGPNLEHTDVEVTDATSQPQPGQIDEEFTATAYPNVQENLKLTVDESVIPEEPASSTRTFSSLQHLAKDFSFGDQFFNDKPSKADNGKTTVDTEAESMVSVTIHQDTSAIPLMTSTVIDLVSKPDSPNIHRPLPTTATAIATTTMTITMLPLPLQPQQGSSDPTLLKYVGELEQHIADLVDANQALEERLDKHGSRLYRLENQDIPNQVRKAVDEIVTDVVDWAMQAPLKERFRDLPEANMKEILHNRIWESKSYQTHEDHMMLYEALEKSMAQDNRPFGTSGASGAFGSSQSPPPPPPLSNNQGGQSTSTAAPSSSKTVASAEYTAWTTTDTRIKSSVSPIPEELLMDDDTTADEQAYSTSGKDIGRDHIPTVNLRQSWWKPLTEDRPVTPEPAWSILSSALTVPMNNWASSLKSTYTPPPKNSLLAQIDDMATFMDWYCKKQGIFELTQKDLEGPAYEIVKVFHPNVVHLQFQMEECHKLLTDQVDDAILRSALSISKMKVAYYPDVGLEQMVPDQMWIEEECKYDIAVMAVQTHMRILSVVRIEVFLMYGYNYMKKIFLRRGHLNHLSPEDKKILTTVVNLWTRNLVIRQRVEDFQLGIESLEKQLNHNVKIIRCDNGTEFKNYAMNELCAKKGIKREFSVDRTPQQNGVAERKNKTLIEDTRTMLADSLLPILFWAEAVNTPCYVLNWVLVTKPQNKIPWANLMENLMKVICLDTLPLVKPLEYPKDQIPGDPKSAVKTRGKIQKASSAQQALFKLQKVWKLVDLPYGKKAIGTKWVFKNKKDERIQTRGKIQKASSAQQALLEAMQEELLQFKLQKVWVLVDLPYGKKSGLKYVADILASRVDFFKARARPRLFYSIESYTKPLVKDEDGVDVDVHVYSHSKTASTLNAVKKILENQQHGGDQFSWKKIDSWQCKKQTIVANSTTETEYVVAANCYGQDKHGNWRMINCAVNSSAHIWSRCPRLNYSTSIILVAFLKKPNESDGFTKVVDFLKGDIVPLLPAMLAGAAMDQGEGSAQPVEPHPTLVDPLPSTSPPHQSSPHSPHQLPPHSPYQSLPHSPFQSSPYSPPYSSPPRSYEAPLPEGNTSGSAEASIQLKELMVLVPSLVTMVTSLEKELKDTKQTLGNVVLKLVKKVKSLEQYLKRKSKKVFVSASEGEELEDRGRRIQDIDDPLVSLVR
ncbi:integrase, catalytic region, zinc finger, CCHC-type containing protein, partial [Tanacetum coccineum]